MPVSTTTPGRLGARTIAPIRVAFRQRNDVGAQDEYFRGSMAGLRTPSWPGDFHPEPLTDPDLTLSRHPARATTGRLPPSVERWSSSRRQMASVGPLRLRWPTPFAPRALHPLHHYYEVVRPSPAHQYFQPRGWCRLCLFPWHRRPGSQVPYESPDESHASCTPDTT